MDVRWANEGAPDTGSRVNMTVKVKENRFSPILKYPGGKEKELKYILPELPEHCEAYYEPFVGGGAVYFALESDRSYINDKSLELISLYRMIQMKDCEFIRRLYGMEESWRKMGELAESWEKELGKLYRRYKKMAQNSLAAVQKNEWKSAGKAAKQELEKESVRFVKRRREELQAILTETIIPEGFADAEQWFAGEIAVSIRDKMVRMCKLEEKKGRLTEDDLGQNLECALKNALYMYFRYLYNHGSALGISESFAAAVYFFMREYCYSSMFRYNRQGEFNVPYGGISYNRKSMMRKLEYFQQETLTEHLKHTVMEHMDFEAFFERHTPGQQDFIFLDPPYDSEFSTYAGNVFDRSDQERLADYLIRRCSARFMLVIKNTEFIRSLYPEGTHTANGGRIRIRRFDKKYMVSFQDRNDKETEHLMISNYE